jgi:hypothetical protein
MGVGGDEAIRRAEPNGIRSPAAFLEPSFGEKLPHFVGFGRMAFNGGLARDHPDHTGPCLLDAQQANLVPSSSLHNRKRSK